MISSLRAGGGGIEEGGRRKRFRGRSNLSLQECLLFILLQLDRAILVPKFLQPLLSFSKHGAISLKFLYEALALDSLLEKC